MNIKILKSDYNSTIRKEVPYIIVLKRNNKNVVYKFAGTLSEDDIDAVYFQEYASKVLRMLKINTPKAKVVSVNSVIKIIKKIRDETIKNETITISERFDYIAVLDFLKIISIKKILKIGFLDAQDLYRHRDTEFTDYANRLAGRIVCGEYLLGIDDRHNHNYMSSKKGLKVNKVWTIDLEDTDNRHANLSTQYYSQLYIYSTKSFLKTKRLYDDIAFIQGFHDVQKILARKKTEVLDLTYKYSKHINDHFINVLKEKMNIIIKNKPIELALNLRSRSIHDVVDSDYLFKKNTSKRIKRYEFIK